MSCQQLRIKAINVYKGLRRRKSGGGYEGMVSLILGVLTVVEGQIESLRQKRI